MVSEGVGFGSGVGFGFGSGFGSMSGSGSGVGVSFFSHFAQSVISVLTGVSKSYF